MSSAARGRAVPPFHAGRIGARAAELARAGRPVVMLHFGQPTLGPPPAALAAARRALDTGPHGYWESAELKARIARHYAETCGVEVPPGRVLLAGGASAALVAAFAALFRVGDRIGLVRPGYPAYRNTLRALDRVPVEIDCGPDVRFRPTPAALARLPAPLHGLVLASPANPTGATLSGAELAALAAFCRDADTRLISDEIYHGLTFEAPAVSALAVDPDAIVVSSFSKLYRMPGWRLGWMVVPEALVGPLSACLGNFFLTPPALAQQAALACFDELPALRESLATYARNRALLLEALPALGCRGVVAPEGAFYFFVDVGHLTQDSLAFCRELLEETGVALAPGIDFDPVHGHGWVRFSFSVETALLEEALARVRAWVAGRSGHPR